ncbi:nucleoside kinase [Sediminispirochaeta bajacaliforniensis]|uniref:nucleoside kinase n=1 Tax=Sediminispirochaeta bajacaliforniensis TaxID=148 RepID=UPI00037266B9|nr:nucleoside kinase [Sediminispirochaeta bajacaliforniensis]
MNQVTGTLPDGSRETVAYGTRVSEFLPSSEADDPQGPVVAALVNNDLVTPSFKIEIDATVEPVKLYSKYGNRIYRRSLSFLLGLASKKVFPDRHLVIGHSLGDGYYYYYNGMAGVGEEEIARLEAEMRAIVKAALPIKRSVISYEQALEMVRKENLPATELLLRYRNDPKIPLYMCDHFFDISYEPLLDNTSLLSLFELRNYPPGFLLRYPRSKEPTKLGSFVDHPLLFSIFKEYKAWGKILDVNCTGRLNQLIEERNIAPFIQVAEALHDKKISQIADQIAQRRDTVRVVLIAGPSSSGKTTFTKKLAIQLQVLGFNPVVIGLDDYFLPRGKTPLDADGNPDLESLHALNIEQLNSHLLALFAGREIEVPIFDFKAGKPKEHGKKLRFGKRNILLMEGIHGLNPDLTPEIPREQKHLVYISALTQLNLDDHNRIATTDNRLCRRMVRDHQFRGNSALSTLEMWPSVRRGEDNNIFPYQHLADSAFNSALDYELAVLKPYVEPLLNTVKPFRRQYSEARRLLAFLTNFSSIPVQYVPQHSILREFVGGSGFSY